MENKSLISHVTALFNLRLIKNLMEKCICIMDYQTSIRYFIKKLLFMKLVIGSQILAQ